MAVFKKYLYSFPNASVFYDPAIAYSEILVVKRQGIGYKEVAGAPVGMQVKYDVNGTLTFDSTIFDGNYFPSRYIPDKILVIYKQ